MVPACRPARALVGGMNSYAPYGPAWGAPFLGPFKGVPKAAGPTVVAHDLTFGTEQIGLTDGHSGSRHTPRRTHQNTGEFCIS